MTPESGPAGPRGAARGGAARRARPAGRSAERPAELPAGRRGARPAVPPVPLPAALLAGAGRTPEGAAWLARVPDLVARARRRWDLEVGAPFPAGSASWCAPAPGPGGEDLVLKVGFPHDEARDEAAVLRAWHGHGAVRLVAAHAGDWVLLLDRVAPGTPMRATRTPVADRLAAGAAVLRALHAAPAPPGLPDLRDVAAGWADLVRDRAARATRAGVRVDPGLLRAALAVLEAPAPSRTVTLHGDLNPGNLLRGPAGWLAIDPKALRGDPAYDPWPLLEQVGAPWRAPDPVRVLRDRTRRVADGAGLDAGAVAGWALARSVEAALWRRHHGAHPAAVRATLARARDWAAVRDATAG